MAAHIVVSRSSSVVVWRLGLGSTSSVPPSQATSFVWKTLGRPRYRSSAEAGTTYQCEGSVVPRCATYPIGCDRQRALCRSCRCAGRPIGRPRTGEPRRALRPRSCDLTGSTARWRARPLRASEAEVEATRRSRLQTGAREGFAARSTARPAARPVHQGRPCADRPGQRTRALALSQRALRGRGITGAVSTTSGSSRTADRPSEQRAVATQMPRQPVRRNPPGAKALRLTLRAPHPPESIAVSHDRGWRRF